METRNRSRVRAKQVLDPRKYLKYLRRNRDFIRREEYLRSLLELCMEHGLREACVEYNMLLIEEKKKYSKYLI